MQIRHDRFEFYRITLLAGLYARSNEHDNPVQQMTIYQVISDLFSYFIFLSLYLIDSEVELLISLETQHHLPFRIE